MKRKNATRSALFTSVISLLLCVSMLVGTTFAWFTDEVKSGTNVIAAGNLDVEVYNDLKIDETKKVTTATKLFDEITYWEPGVVAYENLTVANLGSLALKYQLAVNFTDATTNANGDTLAKVLKVGFVKGGIQSGTREGALDEVSVWLPLESFVQSGDLLKGENDVYGIVIYWQPSDIDNDFNMNNGQTTTMKIDLGIKLFATQLQAEEDSFDETYDEDAWHPDMFVTTAAELAKAIEEVKDGGIIALSDNLTFDKDSATSSGGTWYEGLYYVGDKSFTLDLNGKTITNDPAVNDYLMLFKNDGEKASTITIKNGTLEAASSAYCALCTSTTSTQKITINLENVNLIGNNSNGAVAKIRGGAELNVKAGTVITGKNSYVGIEAVGNDTVVNFYDGAEIYQNGTGSYVGSLIGVSNNATANVYGGYGKSAQGAFIAMTSGGTINVHGGEWIANNDGTYANGNRSALIAQSASGAKSTINVTGGTFKGGYNCYGDAVGDAQINISAGIFNADPSAHVADGYQAIDNGNGTYSVIFPQESFDNLFNNAGENATIEIPAGEFSLPTLSGKEGITIIGAADGSTVIGGENASTGFGSNFGKDTTIKNVTFSGSTNGVRWSYAQGGTSVFENCTFAGDSTYGFHIDEADGATFIFNNCTFIGFNAFAGDLEKIEFNNCTFLSNGNYGNTNVWNVAYYNNCTWGEGAGFDVKAGTEIYVDGVRAASNATSLKEILAADKDLVLMKDIKVTGEKTADRNNYVEAYGNKVGFAQYAGVLDGNGHTITDAEGDKSYLIVTHGGTIKNVIIKTGARGIVTYAPTEDVYIHNVIVDGAGYALNSTEHGNVNMYVTNSTINGWTSLAGFKSVNFTNCKLGENSAKYWQSMGYGQDYDRLFRVYSPTNYTKCEFEQGYYLDLSAGGTANLTDCTVNGVELTAENYADYITIELASGKTLAESVTFG